MKKKKLNKNFFKDIKANAQNMIDTKGKKYFIWYIIIIFLIFIAALVLAFALYIIISCPEFDTDVLYSKESTVLYDVNGNEFARIGSENRELVSYDDLPQVFVDALIATEDSRYFEHNGLDIARFLKASFKQITGSDEGGASTITMQVIKNLYTKGQSKETKLESFVRKFRDIYMAVFKLENCYTKEEIMEFYVNSLWLGHDGNLNYTGIYGVEQASQYYFGKSVSDLTLAESSLLVGMYQNAYLYNPYKNAEGCRNRQKTVLSLMVLHGYITEDEMNAALEIPITSLLTDQTSSSSSNKYQVLIDYVIDDVKEKTGVDGRYTPLKIYTTFDLSVQDVLIRNDNGEFFKYPDDDAQEGVAITSVENGSIVAMSGGRNYQARGLNRASDISRQPGSTAKPFFDYGPYFEYLNGSPGDYLFDEPYTYTNGTAISDADDKYQGMETIRAALSGSRNIPALQAFQKVASVDINLISNYVHSFGIDYGSNLYESASIGGFNGLSPLQESAAYATYARGGDYIEPYSFTKVEYEDGTSYENKYTKTKVVSEETSYMITSILVDAVKNGMNGSINITGTQVAGKTGTTTIDKSSREKIGLPDTATMDSWNVTYDSEYCIALWYGYDELNNTNYLTSTKGYTARSRIMAGLAKNIYSTNKTFTKPSGIVEVEVEKYTIPLQLPSEYTPEDMRMTEVFKDGNEPTEVSTRYSKLSAPTGGKSSINGNTITVTWTGISTPDAINTTYLQNYFNENYGTFASKYYEERISYNNEYIGTLGYLVSYTDETGTSTGSTWVNGTSYTTTIESGKNYTFNVKSAYSIFRNNASDPLVIKVSGNGSSSNTTNNDNNTTNTTNNNNNNSLD